MEYSIEQEYAIGLFESGENIALMGPAGTGKTTLVKKFKEIAERKEKRIAITAMTGCAALLLGNGAKTLSSWSGLRVPKGDPANVIHRFQNYRKNEPYFVEWEKVKILLIDEMSMMSQYMFEILDRIGKNIRNSEKPFGGIQVICIGDFHQLPPIPNAENPNSGNYCFQSPIWKKTFPEENQVLLKTIFRQSDPMFQSILSGIRGDTQLSTEQLKTLRSCLNKEYDETKYEGCHLPKIVPTRAECDRINKKMFSKINSPTYSFEIDEMTDCRRYVGSSEFLPISQEVLTRCFRLKTKDIENEIKILKTSLPSSETFHVKIGATVMCTINLDLDCGICNGSIGVVTNISKNCVTVKFSNGHVKDIARKEWQSEDYPTIVVSHIPLILAWAITIHKSQGATLPMAEINVGNDIFAEGQVYVAISRVKSLEGLYLSSFNQHRIRVNPMVKEFYANIPEIEFEYSTEEEEMLSSENESDFEETTTKTINFDQFAYDYEKSIPYSEANSDIKTIVVP